MRPAALLARTRDLGSHVTEEGGRLRVEGAALTDELMAEIRAAKTEILNLLRCDGAGEATPHEINPLDTGAAWNRPGPWRWVNPDNSPGDLALLRAIDRLDCERSEPPTVRPCYGCGNRDWWRSIHGGHFTCRHCHPPVPGAEDVGCAVSETAAAPKDPA